MTKLSEVPFKKGDTVVYDSRDMYMHQIRNGDVGKVLSVMFGIFDTPYAKVEVNGKVFCSYYYRWKKVEVFYRIRVGKNKFNDPHYVTSVKPPFNFTSIEVNKNPKSWKTYETAKKHLINLSAQWKSVEIEQILKRVE